jgi:hypothetical protein
VRGHRRRRRRRRRERGAAGPVWSGHLTQLSHMCFTAPGRPPTRSPRRRPLRPSPPSVGRRAAGPRPPSESASERGPPALASPLPAALPCFFSARSRALAWSDWSPGPGPRESRPTARAFLSPGLWAPAVGPAPPAQFAQGRRDGRRDCPRVYLVPRRTRTLGPGPTRARVPTLPSCDACLRARLRAPGSPPDRSPPCPTPAARPPPPALRLVARQ